MNDKFEDPNKPKPLGWHETSERPFRPNSAIGQHILLDQTVLETALELLPEGEKYIEIGAGPGTLTGGLIQRSSEVTAYEIDRRCEPQLGKLALSGRLKIQWCNFLEVDNAEFDSDMPFHIVGNIPFHISEPLIAKLAEIPFTSAVLLVGENLAMALMAPNPNSKSWSRMSLFAAAYFDIEKVLDVPNQSFDPPPRVNAALVRLTRKDASPQWRSDAVARSYRALVEAQATNSTVAKALKTVILTARGDAETGREAKQGKNHRSERRVARLTLTEVARNYNFGSTPKHGDAEAAQINQTMLQIVSKVVDERLLSKPLVGLSNSELTKICSAITAAVNRRKKTRPSF